MRETIMKTIELQLDEQTIEHAKRLAALRNSTLEELISEIIRRMKASEDVRDPLWGAFADDADILDEIVKEVMTARGYPPNDAGG
jgi:hypothetical protein